MDKDLLKRRLVSGHECEVVFVGQPVDIGAVVVSEVDLHVLDHVVVEVLEIPVEDVEVPVPGGDCLVAPELQEESDIVLGDVAGIELQSVVAEDTVDVD